jgi:hypothetical protein
VQNSQQGTQPFERFAIAMLVIACAIIRPLAGQSPALPAATSAPNVTASAPLTLTGCVARDDETSRLAVLGEAKSGRYELTRSELRPFVGRRVHLNSESLNRLHIVGGLWPTPNAAAQAGALDPEQGAIAALPGGGSRGDGPSYVREFKVPNVPILKGSCPE